MNAYQHGRKDLDSWGHTGMHEEVTRKRDGPGVVKVIKSSTHMMLGGVLVEGCHYMRLPVRNKDGPSQPRSAASAMHLLCCTFLFCLFGVQK